MNKAVQKVSFKFRLGLVIHFLHALAGGGYFTFSKALACRLDSNLTCTYVTLMIIVMAYGVNCEKC